jgi:hypothetical protein
MKKIGLLAIALILAVGSLGVGLAHWSGSLAINGTVNMEDFCVGWYYVTGGDPNVDGAGNPIVNLDEVYDGTGFPEIAPQDIGWSEWCFYDWVCDCDIPGFDVDVPH